MSDVDASRREVETHAAKKDVHRTDDDARAACDGQIDADTVDGQHAGDLGSSFNTENGSFFTGSNNSTTESIAFSNSYKPEAFIPSAGNDTGSWTNYGYAAVSSLTTDGEGNITGMDVRAGTDNASGEVFWYVLGELA